MKETDRLADEFAACRKMLQALGDENRQHLILEMLRTGECGGVRVGAMAARTNLSRPVVSRHLRILRAAGLIRVRDGFVSVTEAGADVLNAIIVELI